MKENNFKRYLRECLLLSFTCMFFGNAIAQDLYIGDGGEFYLKASTDFTTSNSVINHHSNGVFVVEAGNAWSAATEYVNGKITVIGAGTTTVNVGDGAQSTVTITTIAGDAAICDYTLGAPPAGTITALGDFALSETEYWTVTNTGPSFDVTVTGLSEKSSATYGGEASGGRSIVIVRLDGADWKQYSGNAGFGTFALAVDITVLGTNEFNVENFSFYPNPVKANATSINFYLPSTVNQLDVTMYDYTGKTVKLYKDVSIQVGVNSIDKPNIAEGLYLLQFSFNNGEQQIIKKVVIE